YLSHPKRRLPNLVDFQGFTRPSHLSSVSRRVSILNLESKQIVLQHHHAFFLDSQMKQMSRSSEFGGLVEFLLEDRYRLRRVVNPKRSRQRSPRQPETNQPYARWPEAGPRKRFVKVGPLCNFKSETVPLGRSPDVRRQA
ncbi:hypothetical protein BC936DRAFT_141955, partial [Jimgerdemannia flammicorona]